MDRFLVEINLKDGYLEGVKSRNEEIKRLLQVISKNVDDLYYDSTMILRDPEGQKIGYARYERTSH